MIPVSNLIPQIDSFGKIRITMLKLSGIRIGRNTKIWGPVTVRPMSMAQNLTIGSDCFINSEVRFGVRGGIKICDRVLIGPRVSIESVAHSIEINENGKRSTVLAGFRICDDSWICANTVVLPGTTIGKRSVVGANSTVTKNIEDDQLWAGSPARKIKSIAKCVS